MSKIIKVDTNGVKPLLDMRELGYDNYPAGGDVGRVYVGTGTANIALAKKSEIDDVINGSVLVDGRDVSLDGAKLDTIASGAQVNDVNTTVQGNTFNGNSQLVQTTVEGKLPVLDGSNLTNVVSAGSVDLTTAQTIAGVKTFSSNPLSSASQSTNSNALTKYSAVVKNTGNETIAGVKTFSSSPIVPTPTTGTQVANKDYVDANAGETITAGDGLIKSGTTLDFYPFGLTTASTELTTSDYVVVSDSTSPKKITLENFMAELGSTTSFQNSKSASGYTKLPNGLIIQWGRGSAGSSVVFPIAFPSSLLKVIPQHRYDIGSVNGAFIYVSSSSRTGFTRTDQTFECEYIAIGY